MVTMILRSLGFYIICFSGLFCCAGLSFAQEGAEDTAEVASPDDVASESGEGEEEHSADHGDDHSHGSHGGEHDNDPTHANMADGGLSIVEFRTDMALFTAVVFGLLMFGLTAFAWKPIMEGLEKRESRIAGNIQKAEQDAKAAAKKLADYEQKLAAANEESQQIVATARKDAEAAGQKIVAAAQEEAARLQDRAADEIESAKRVALGELTNQSTAIAMSVAGRVVGREVNAEDHNSLIQEMLSKLPSEN